MAIVVRIAIQDEKGPLATEEHQILPIVTVLNGAAEHTALHLGPEQIL
jgi:hypothetical protein